MPEKDSIIVLSHYLTPDLELSSVSKARVEKCVEMYKADVAPYIVMNGGPGKLTEETNGSWYLPRNSGRVHCDFMANYAIKLGVTEDHILTQEYSSDTVGEAYFVKELILIPNDWRNNIVVTDKSQEDRAREIYSFILGSDFTTEFEIVEAESEDLDAIIAREQESLQIFQQQFGNVTPGDSAAIEEILYELHTIYRNLPEEKKLRIYTKSPQTDGA